ncbi:MAG: 3-methyladenine DNA glycosylase [Marmoricola sp.]
MENLPRETWEPCARAHADRVDTWVQPHLERRRQGVRHPVHDFLFTYYSQSPAALRRWHPGWGVGLLDAPEYADLKGYSTICPESSASVSASVERLSSQLPVVTAIRRLLVATAGRAPTLGCFGLHEWAMVHQASSASAGVGAGAGEIRHDWPLRLGGRGTDEVVDSHRITCSHFDAFRFFSDTARPLNTLQPARDDRTSFEQPGCLHAGMDLYKHAFRLTPLVASELVVDCFELAWDIRELDMRASPYDFSELGFAPVRIETPEGKQEYVAAQRTFAERGAPLRQRLIAECTRLLDAGERASASAVGNGTPPATRPRLPMTTRPS